MILSQGLSLVLQAHHPPTRHGNRTEPTAKTVDVAMWRGRSGLPLEDEMKDVRVSFPSL